MTRCRQGQKEGAILDATTLVASELATIEQLAGILHREARCRAACSASACNDRIANIRAAIDSAMVEIG